MGEHFIESKKRILFRADAFPAIGTGDLMSLINLSFYFEADGWQTFFMVKSHKAAQKLIDKYAIDNVRMLDTGISIPSEVKAINRYVELNGIDLVFFEITENRLSDYQGLVPDVAKACVCFDGKIPDGMDLVMDWDVEYARYFQPEKYPGTKFILGPEYVILPYSFDQERIRKRRFRKPPEKILICMGGADEHDFTRKVVKKVTGSAPHLEMVIIVGAGYEHKDELQRYLSKKGCRYTIKENISTMFEEYLNCDVAVGAGGLVSSELVATGTPALLIATYQHQEARCSYYAQNGWATYLGNRENWDITDRNFNNAMVCKTPEIFCGTEIIVNACNEFV